MAFEVLAADPRDPARVSLEAGFGTRISITEIPDKVIEWSLGAGESSVIAACLAHPGSTAVLYDAEARACARTLGVPLIGTLGIVSRARTRRSSVPPYRVKLAGAWLETALRAGGSIAEPLATLVAEIRRGDDGDVWRFNAAAVLRRARILHREHELAPMIEALKPRLDALFRSGRTTDDAYQLTVVTGDVTAIIAAGGDTPNLAKNVEVARGPLDRAFATASTMPDSSALMRVWARWLEAGADPVLGAKPTAALCPVSNRAPATPATGVLTAKQLKLPKQSECSPHDVTLTLTIGGAVRATRTLEGECTGACTKAEKRAGAAEKARIDSEISSGDLDPAAANYSFTGCSFVGFKLDEVQLDDNRQFAILSQHYQEAHDTDVTRPRLAFEVCGDIYLTDPIHVSSAMPWETPHLNVAVERDVVVVRSVSDRGSDVVLRLALPTCPGVPTIVD